MLALAGDLHATILFLPVIVVVQFILMCGMVWLAAAAQVYFRDVANIVGLLLLMLFYVTPVFYSRSSVSHYGWVLRLNPMTTVIEAWRQVTLEGTLPLRPAFGILAGVSVLGAAVGIVVFRRLSRGFVDEL
jgi:lipopolysaccharide transport system permease protein